jgi:hypothetical protein
VSEPAEVFDPRGLLAALDRNYVGYVLIGGLARVIRGTDELTSGVDICPGLRFENVDRLARALEELEARRADRRRLVVDEDTLAQEAVLELRTNRGGLKVVAEPAGTRRATRICGRRRRGSILVRGCGRGWRRWRIWHGCRRRWRTSASCRSRAGG